MTYSAFVPVAESYQRYDVIWTIEPPDDKISSVTSEHCPGLDEQHAAEP